MPASSTLPDALVHRYLALLDISPGDASPTLANLSAIVRRHLVRVPFENVSKLLLFSREGAGRPLTLAEFLDGIERHDFGGTCYSSNPFLAELLSALGYDASLLGADMSEPNVHTSIRVGLDGRAWHVDVGYAAPFLEPIPLDRLPWTTALGRDRYVFELAATKETADCGGLNRGELVQCYEMTHYTDGERRHGYVVHAPPRRFSFFHPTIVRSFGRDWTFMRNLRITRFLENGGAVELRGSPSASWPRWTNLSRSSATGSRCLAAGSLRR